MKCYVAALRQSTRTQGCNERRAQVYRAPFWMPGTDQKQCGGKTMPEPRKQKGTVNASQMCRTAWCEKIVKKETAERSPLRRRRIVVRDFGQNRCELVSRDPWTKVRVSAAAQPSLQIRARFPDQQNTLQHMGASWMTLQNSTAAAGSNTLPPLPWISLQPHSYNFSLLPASL